MVMRGVGWKGIDDVLFHRKKTTIPAQPLLEVKVTKAELYIVVSPSSSDELFMKDMRRATAWKAALR